jgi:hypothetical protein
MPTQPKVTNDLDLNEQGGAYRQLIEMAEELRAASPWLTPAQGLRRRVLRRGEWSAGAAGAVPVAGYRVS